MSDSYHREMSHLIDAVLMPPAAAPAIIPSSAQHALELATTGAVRRVAIVTSAMRDPNALSRLMLETTLARQCSPSYQSSQAPESTASDPREKTYMIFDMGIGMPMVSHQEEVHWMDLADVAEYIAG